ncbi:hypothetical protein JRQ81_015916, partial [Phrynocephalus forsythii]
LQNIPEDKESDLFVQINEALAEAIGLEFPEMVKEIEQVYRVNSRFARENKVPREVHVKFIRRAVRDMILRASSDKPLKCQGQEILVLKQIPWKVRDVRKHYQFLTVKLNEKRINFRWLVPEGIFVNWDETAFSYRASNLLQLKKVVRDTRAADGFREIPLNGVELNPEKEWF